jgi:hypothetical protein
LLIISPVRFFSSHRTGSRHNPPLRDDGEVSPTRFGATNLLEFDAKPLSRLPLTAEPLDQLRSLVAQLGTVDAAITLGRHPIAVARMKDGIDPVTDEVARRLIQRNDPQLSAV